MLYTISVKLALSSNMLKDYLSRNGFEVYYYDTITDNRYDITDSHHLDHGNYVYYCIYNSHHKPHIGLVNTLLKEPTLELKITKQ